MGGALKVWGDLLRGAGGSLMSLGGFFVDGDGQLIEVYDDTEEDWPEGKYSGDESQDGEDFGWSDCIWSDSECDRA